MDLHKCDWQCCFQIVQMAELVPLLRDERPPIVTDGIILLRNAESVATGPMCDVLAMVRAKYEFLCCLWSLTGRRKA